jgi:HSP20 family molecular chaperone IbpA
VRLRLPPRTKRRLLPFRARRVADTAEPEIEDQAEARQHDPHQTRHAFTVAQTGTEPAVAPRRRDIDDLQSEVQELFADLWQVPRFSGLRRGFRPQCDCYVTEDPPTLHVVLEVAGIDPKSVSVVASGRMVAIAGTRERPRTPGARYQAMEIEEGPFERRFDLGLEVDSQRASATYDRGMLKIVLPIVAR